MNSDQKNNPEESCKKLEQVYPGEMRKTLCEDAQSLVRGSTN